MPDDFIGELTKATLLDLVEPLLDGKKSGMVRIKGDGIGELHIEGGKIIHARTRNSLGEEAILEMLEWGAGLVTFDWKATTDARTVSVATEELLLSWASREQEWKRIKEVIPSPNMTFRIPLESSPEGRLVQADQWRVLALASGAKAVSEIAEALGWDLFKASRTIYFMVQAGLLEKASEKKDGRNRPAVRYVDGNFFSTAENELRKAMGPIAPIIMDDTIAELGLSRETFPVDQAGPLVQAISQEIADNEKRAEFVKMMTEFLARKRL